MTDDAPDGGGEAGSDAGEGDGAAPAPILVAREGGVTVVTLNRPERLNAVSIEMYRALYRVLGRADRDREVRAVLITGAGRAFCVGADLKAHGEGPPPPAVRTRYIRLAQAVARRVQLLSRPVVAAVNGHAIGAGLELACSADFVVVAREAKLRFPEAALGTFVGAASPTRCRSGWGS